MRRLLRVVVYALTLPLASVTASAQTATSTFDADLEGWLAVNGAANTLEVAWSPIDGNPGGFARFEDAVDGTTYHAAPAEFLGNWSALDGIGMISYDQKGFGLWPTSVIHAYEIIIGGPGGVAVYQEPTVVPNVLVWTTVVAPLTEKSWVLREGAWGALLDDVTRLDIRADPSGSSRDIAGLDNVFLGIPEPATLCLLVAGALVVLRRRR